MVTDYEALESIQMGILTFAGALVDRERSKEKRRAVDEAITSLGAAGITGGTDALRKVLGGMSVEQIDFFEQCVSEAWNNGFNVGESQYGGG